MDCNEGLFDPNLKCFHFICQGRYDTFIVHMVRMNSLTYLGELQTHFLSGCARSGRPFDLLDQLVDQVRIHAAELGLVHTGGPGPPRGLRAGLSRILPVPRRLLRQGARDLTGDRAGSYSLRLQKPVS